MDICLRPLIEAEQKFAFASNSSEVDVKTGLIGHLRVDFGSNGKGFYTTWFDTIERLKTEAFKTELDEVINSLREKGEVLSGLSAMQRWCYTDFPRAEFESRYRSGAYGARADTEEYAYVFRFFPQRGDYNAYCYCYVKKWLAQFLRGAAKGVRFIDSHYTELFRVKDGDRVLIHFADGEDKEYTVRYIDDYHIEIGTFDSKYIYHICEFAERMERSGATYEPVKEGS